MDYEQTVPQGMRESTPVERILDLAFEPSSRKQESPGFSRGECQRRSEDTCLCELVVGLARALRTEGEIMSKMQRNLDGIYFRIERDGKWMNVCYSDMEQRERDEVARKRAETSTPAEQAQWWRSMADLLADALYDMGEQLDVTCI